MSAGKGRRLRDAACRERKRRPIWERATARRSRSTTPSRRRSCRARSSPAQPIDKLALVRTARRVALSGLGGDQPARVRAAGAWSSRSTARSSRESRPTTCASGCSSAARWRARSPPRRRGGCRAGGRAAGGQSARGGQGGGSGRPGAFLCARRRLPRGADARISALHRSGEILDGVRAHLERVRRLLMPPPGRMQADARRARAPSSRRSRARDPEAARGRRWRRISARDDDAGSKFSRASGPSCFQPEARQTGTHHEPAARPAPQRAKTTS